MVRGVPTLEVKDYPGTPDNEMFMDVWFKKTVFMK